jgi:polyisoprenoid-binding protein YceI
LRSRKSASRRSKAWIPVRRGPADDDIDVVGDLTIKGITREVVLRVEQLGQAKDPWGNVRAAFSAKTSIDRKDFGLTWNQVLETGGVVVGDRVEIEAEIQAVKQVEAQVA